MSLKTWFTGILLSTTLSGQAQEAHPEAPQQKQNTTEVKAPSAVSVAEKVEHIRVMKQSLIDQQQQLGNMFGPQGSKISATTANQQAIQQDLSLATPEMRAQLFQKDLQQMLKEEFQTTMSEFQKRIEKRTSELHTKYGNFIADGSTDNQKNIGIQGSYFPFEVSIRYDLTTNSPVVEFKSKFKTKRETPLAKKLQKGSKKEILSNY